jgi:hypothetical protein
LALCVACGAPVRAPSRDAFRRSRAMTVILVYSRHLVTSVSAESYTDRLQRGDQPLSLAGIGGGKLRHTLGEEAARAARIPEGKCPHRERDPDRARTTGEIGQVALVAAMHRREQQGTTQAACRRCSRQLENHVCRLSGHVGEAHRASGWEHMRDKRMECPKCIAH